RPRSMAAPLSLSTPAINCLPRQLAVTNVPAGFSPQVAAGYATAGGTSFVFTSNGVLNDVTQYPVLPAGARQAADSYGFVASAIDVNNSIIEIAQTIAAGSGPVTLGPLPTPWSFSGPTPSALPTFAFDTYSGFNGQMPSQTFVLASAE